METKLSKLFFANIFVKIGSTSKWSVYYRAHFVIRNAEFVRCFFSEIVVANTYQKWKNVLLTLFGIPKVAYSRYPVAWLPKIGGYRWSFSARGGQSF